MQSITFSDLAALLHVAPLQLHNDTRIDHLLSDSRKLLLPEHTLFFAVNSPQRKATRYIPDLYDRGVRSFVTGSDFGPPDIQVFPEGNFIQVEDVVEAMQQLTAFKRHQFNYPVIGITGSNGKTIVKEWLYQLLNSDYNIVRSPKSYNSQIGVPLSVWNMTDSHTLGIFEAGISMPGEMIKLQRVIDPTFGIFTYAGEAHAHGFESMDQKVAEKLLLFKNSEILIYCKDDSAVQPSVENFNRLHPSLKLFNWSFTQDAVLQIRKVVKHEGGSSIYCTYQSGEFEFFIPFIDEASVHNAITCCCVLLYLGYAHATIAAQIAQLCAVEMRLELKEGINNCSIINDSYSADMNSLVIALDFLSQQQQHEKKTVILSDVLQSGVAQDELYGSIASILNRKELFRFVGIGPDISARRDLFHTKNIAFFDSTEDLLKNIHQLEFEDETILLKGARIFRFEKISHALEQKMHETMLEIDLNALRNNFKVYSQLLRKNVKMMAMVKAFSYGSGSYEIANVLQHAGIDYLAVAYADEGVALRLSGIRLPVMVMNTEESGFANIIQYKLEPEIYSFNILKSFVHYLQSHHVTNYPVHIKLDTGMHRLGFLPGEVDQLCMLLPGIPSIRIISVFSHLAASDEALHDDFTRQQGALLVQMSDKIERTIGYEVTRHISNTAAIQRHPDMQFDMVRLGIGLYGIDPSLRLQNVTTLRTSISQIKHVSKGESVGYSRKAVVAKDSVIAIVRIGYADGYPRALGNGIGKMLVNDQLVSVIGNVCMDMTMLDITGIEANEDDEVIVFGEDLPVTQVAFWANTIPYEILTNISQRVKRVYFEE